MKTLFLWCIAWLSTVAATAQTDTIPPTIICKSGWVRAELMLTGMVSFWPTDHFLDTLYDNVSTNIERGIRKTCIGTGFPEGSSYVTFYQIGLIGVELWARDEAGNSASCICKIDLQLGHGCNLDAGLLIPTTTETGSGIVDVTVKMNGYHCYQDSISAEDIGYSSNGMVILRFFPEPGTNFTLTPSKNDNPLNGVTPYDLVLISKHILGIQALDSPHKIIAADANLDGMVTTADILLLRKLLLGLIQELPHGQSWRFVPSDYLFPDASNPFAPSVPDNIHVPFSSEQFEPYYKFTGVKIGDVNNSAVPN